jgi:glucokinase
MKRIGAVDIGGSKMAIGIVREDGTILDRRECVTLPERGFIDAMTRIESMLREMMATAGPIDGIGVGCPGPLSPLTGTLLEVSTLPGWKECNLIASLESSFGVSVAVENDADAAALAELAWGDARASKRFIYITISTGIGGGIVLDHQLYRGVDGAHPELGHQIIDATGPLCYCGAHGCWESLASGTAISAWMQTMEPEAGPMSAAAICERAVAGDTLALEAVRRQGH